MSMLSSRNLEATLPQFLERVFLPGGGGAGYDCRECQQDWRWKPCRAWGRLLPRQVRYTEQKMKMETEEMKLSMVEREEKVLEESLEGRLEKERNLAVIESARSEQSMLREAVRNLKIEKIRLLKKMEVYSDKKNVRMFHELPDRKWLG